MASAKCPLPMENPLKALTWMPGRYGFGLAEVVFEVLPVIAALVVGAERAAGIVTAMHHAMFAARIARDAVHNPVFFPLHL